MPESVSSDPFLTGAEENLSHVLRHEGAACNKLML